jgi:hypothetical protein
MGTKPKYKSDGVAVWENTTLNGKKYLKIQLFGKDGILLTAWENVEVKNEPTK